jgi:hypothetical protein
MQFVGRAHKYHIDRYVLQKKEIFKGIEKDKNLTLDLIINALSNFQLRL